MNTSKIQRCSVLLVVLFLFATNVAAQYNFSLKKLDSLMDQLSSKNKFMGSVTISKSGHTLFNKAYGSSLISGTINKKSTIDTKYRIGSITKMFTSVMIFQLIEEKKLSLDTKLAAYFPEIPNAQSISISNLMNHRSGIHNVTDDSSYFSWNTKPQTEKEMISRMKKVEPDFAPDEKAAYSNSNYILLGYIIEKITKKDYAHNLKERITNKIGLKNTYYGGKTNTNADESFSYDYDGGKWVQESETDMTVPHGAGAIVSTTNDLATFITSLFQGKLISKVSLDSMTSLNDKFGRGIFLIPFYDRYAYGHNGGIDKFVSAVSYFRDDSISVAICTNGLHYNMNDIAIGILSILYNKHYEIPALKDVRVAAEVMKKYEGIYASDDLPIKLTIKTNGSGLTAQGTGQSAFPLDPISDTEFTFAAAKIEIRFSKDTLILKQNGAEYTMTREK